MRKTGEISEGIGCAIICGAFTLLIGLIFWFDRQAKRAESPEGYRQGTLRQQVYTAEVDRLKAAKLLAEGRKAEGEEALSVAEEKLFRGQQEKADQTFLTKVEGQVGEIKTAHASDINPIRRQRAQQRLRSKAEDTRLLLRLLRRKAAQRRAETRAQSYRDDAWDALLDLSQQRISRQPAGAESFLESPFRVDPAQLRQALLRGRGARYVQDMDRYAPGACEAVAKEAESLAEAP